MSKKIILYFIGIILYIIFSKIQEVEIIEFIFKKQELSMNAVIVSGSVYFLLCFFNMQNLENIFDNYTDLFILKVGKVKFYLNNLKKYFLLNLSLLIITVALLIINNFNVFETIMLMKFLIFIIVALLLVQFQYVLELKLGSELGLLVILSFIIGEITLYSILNGGDLLLFSSYYISPTIPKFILLIATYVIVNNVLYKMLLKEDRMGDR